MGKIIRKGVVYGGANNNANDIKYDNTNSGLSAENIQAAIDEIVAGGVGGGNSTANCFGTPVDLKDYTKTNKYTFPSDGYVVLRVTGSSATNNGNVFIFGADNTTQTQDFAISVGNTADNLAQSDSVFVRKGMHCSCSLSSISVTAKFYPLIGSEGGTSGGTSSGSINLSGFYAYKNFTSKTSFKDAAGTTATNGPFGVLDAKVHASLSSYTSSSSKTSFLSNGAAAYAVTMNKYNDTYYCGTIQSYTADWDIPVSFAYRNGTFSVWIPTPITPTE